MYSSYIGFWKENDYNGRGKLVLPITKYNMKGHFEDGEFMVNGDGIKLYDVKKDICAAGIDLKAYSVITHKTEIDENGKEKIVPMGYEELRA